MNAKELVATAVRLLVKEGLIGLHGHVSMRKSNHSILILGHLHNANKLPKNATAEDIIEVDFSGKLIEGKWGPPEEIPIHLELYHAFPEVNSVIHAHPFHCIALSTTGTSILPIWTKGRFFEPEIPVWSYSSPIANKNKAKEMVERFGQGPALLLQGHGTVNTGKSVEEACVLAIALEETARMQLLVSSLAKPAKLPPDEEGLSTTPSKKYIDSMWNYYLHR